MPLLTVLGAINWDISIFVERFARPGEEVVVSKIEEFSGGKGANVAVAAARILGRGKVNFVGALGKDRIGEMQLEELRREGVLTDCIEFVNERSGSAYIVVDSKGKKQINTFFGANRKLSVEHLKRKEVRREILDSEMIVIMDIPVKTALAISELAREEGIKFVYSPGVMVKEGLQLIKSISKDSEFLVLDTVEMLNLYGSERENDSINKIKNDFHSAIVTRGEKGCSLIEKGREKLIRAYNPEEFNGRVVNTTGCGDAFLGVFSSYFVLGQDVINSLRLANLAGAIKATRIETRGSPSREELERIFEEIEGIKVHQRKKQRNISS